ncbi:MAG: PHP domain-containing protein [Smithellaceae bacterium]
MNMLGHEIFFEKPDIYSLRKRFTLFDLHFHTSYTDGQNGVDAIAARARALGIGIAITDHNDIRGALEMALHKDVPFIPGIEVTSREGTHVLLYFYNLKDLRAFYRQFVRPCLGPSVMSSTALSLESILAAARGFDALCVFPHPFCALYTGVCNLSVEPPRLDRLLQSVDGIEVINAENLHRWNLKCARLGRNLRKSLTGGSDGHSLYSMGRVVTCAACAPTGRAMLDAVRARQTMVIGKEINLLRKMAAGGAKMNVDMARYPELLQKNFRYGYHVIHAKSRALRDRLNMQPSVKKVERFERFQ